VTRIFVIVVALFFSIASGQDQAIVSHANLVPVPVLVKDETGQVVYGLHASDFVVADDGVEQTVHLDEPSENAPLSLIIAVQNGRRAKREFERIAGLRAMLDPILSDTSNEAAVLTFDSKLNLVQDFTHDSGLIGTALTKLDPGDHGAAILDAVALSVRLLGKQSESQRVLLLLSETRDHGSHFAKLDEVVRLVEVSNTLVFAVPFSPYISQQLDVIRGSNADEWSSGVDIAEKLAALRQGMRRNTPKTLASLTGGEYSLFATRDQFETAMLQFVNHLHSHYMLSFEPQDPHAGIHQIRVRLRGSKAVRYTILHRTTYWFDNAHPNQ